MADSSNESPTHTTQPTTPAGVFRAPGVGERLDISGIGHLFRLTAADTEGRFSVEEFTVPANVTGVPPHIHDAHDEYFYILDGQLTLWAGDAEVVADAGAVVAAPRGVPHGYRNDTEQPATALCLYTPAGYENYFREVHAAIASGEEVSEDKLVQFRAKYATRPYPALR
jgi:quercetin dioxygenase-like cupin family protein